MPRRFAGRVAGLLLLPALFAAARQPSLPAGERSELVRRFHFTRLDLTTLDDGGGTRVRAVHPSLGHISAWISSVGAAVAMADLDGDGLANDVCLVDPRADQVSVAVAPGTEPPGGAYAVFALDPRPLPYDGTMAPMGCLPADLNEDGLQDVLVYYWGRTPVAFLREPTTTSLHRGSFRPIEIVPGRERWFTNAVTRADLDGDGHADLVVGNYFPDGSRILDPFASGSEQMQDSMSRALNGGRNRLLLCGPEDDGPRRSVRCREAPDALAPEAALGWTLAAGAADLDGDLLPEIYFANDFGPDRLLHNQSRPGQPRFEVLAGAKTLVTPNSKVLNRDSFKGMGVDFGDVSGDGALDIYVSNIAADYALEESHFLWVATGAPAQMRSGVAPYTDRSEPLGLSRSGWAWDARLADFDNDGTLEAVQALGFVKGDVNRWPELHELAMANDALLRHPDSWFRCHPGDDLSGQAALAFFSRDRRGRFADVAADLGLAAGGVSRGLATSDVDGDGDLDLAVARQWAPSSLFRNDVRTPAAFLGLRLLLPIAPDSGAPTRVERGLRSHAGTARPAIGAAATVFLPPGVAPVTFLPELRRLVAQVDGGNGHSGKRSPDLHFGLGPLRPHQELGVELRWRDGAGIARRQRLTMAPGWHTVVLGAGEAEGSGT